MIQRRDFTHELYSNDDTLEVDARVYQGDHGNVEVTIAFTREGVNYDLSGCAVSITNQAPNGATLKRVAAEDTTVQIEGSHVVWTLDKFDTQQVGAYKAQVHVATDAMTVTVVFVKYNVERSVSGPAVTVPIQYTTLSALAAKIVEFKEQAAQIESQLAELNAQYDVFSQIIEDANISWSAIPGKPETFPPSAHTHDQYAEQATVDALDDRVVDNANDIASLETDKADRAHLLEAVLWAADWAGDAAPYTQTIDVPGMKEHGLYAVEYERSDVPSVQIVREKQWGYIGTFIQAEGQVTAQCSIVKPGVDYRVKFYYLGSEVVG